VHWSSPTCAGPTRWSGWAIRRTSRLRYGTRRPDGGRPALSDRGAGERRVARDAVWTFSLGLMTPERVALPSIVVGAVGVRGR
jgi:hypothetical protein